MRFLLLIALLLFTTAAYSQKPELKVGDIAPPFMLNNNTISTMEFKGSVWMLEFWASWCLPCRKHHIHLTRTYKQYKDKKFKQGKKFNIASISIDTNKRLWDLAIVKDGLGWKTQICDLDGWSSPLVSLYRVNKIPSNFIIDPGGKIIAKDIWNEKLDSVLLEMLQ